ncbi:MAG: hypothetical protein A2057_08745 [Ignavibacteria bacterium GWA2_35_9]|nr:MAG: hypothetical protein A2057_08745 [Ignavibacteria bacterium GWA2_35_9]OGU45986.1 MAG: hypothetical protein A2000_15250 [Ignavibacteria bacterium GWB2_36_8]OGU52879.1 MAG: hypothetical protein A2080_10725 [Ignavibacteria bacterium GWC2_36_12]
MKPFVLLTLFFCILFFSPNTFGQFDIEKKIKKKVEKKLEKEVDKTIDKGIEETEEAIKKGGEDDSEGKKPENDPANKPTDKDTLVNSETDQSPRDMVPQEELKVWSKYDFVSGDKIIFEDNLINEKHGEFPLKWNLLSGNAEIAKFGDDNVIAFMINKTEISPLMKTKEYLPEVFTIEFDIYIHNKGNEAYYLNLKNTMQIDIRTNKVSSRDFVGEPDESSRTTGWHHIALSFNQRALKVYFDQTRVLNIPNIEKKPTSFTISALSHGANKGNPSMIKNIRIAEGGVELYDRLMTDGKIVTRGIYFDVGKATIKPESMGVINEIAKLMNDHPEIRLSVEGHTDSDGNDTFNQTLSKNRANAVKNALVSLGIELSRLEAAGWGESKPLNSNLTPEEKANNRRVEFIKI